MSRVDSGLAILGAAPKFAEVLHVGRPTLPRREALQEAIDAVLERHWLTNNGPSVQDLERRLAQLLSVKHCVTTCNGTIALQLTLRALALSGEVIVPAFTFVATAHALRWERIRPVFCDIDPGTHNLDPACVEAAITPRTTGILGVHIWGRPCAIETLAQTAQRHRLTLLFDAAHGFACSHHGRPVGNFGVAEVFSFHATKFFHTVEGGAVTTNDDELAESLRRMRNHGFVGVDRVAGLGINGKMNEVCAAVGLTLLDDLDDLIAINRRNYKLYEQQLAAIPGLGLCRYNEAERSNYQYIVVEVDEALTGLSRDELMQVLWAENVRARRYFYPGCHRSPPSTEEAGTWHLPATDQLCERVLCLPTGTAIGPREVEGICDRLAAAVANSKAVRDRLADYKGRPAVE